MSVKKIFNPKSKTHWTTAAVGFFGAMMTFLPTVQEFVSVEIFGPITIFVGLAFHYLRNITSTAIDEK